MQRKLTYFVLFVGFLTISLFFACRKDNSVSNQDKPDPNAAMNVDLAQSYYYNSLMKKPGTTIQTNLSVNSTGSNAVPGEKNYKYLMFGLSHNSQTANVTYTEIPLRYNRRPSSVVANDDQTGNYASKLKILNASFDRLLIYKDKTTNQIDQSVVTYIPDADYLKRHNNDISGNQIDKLDSDFNGYLEYRKWDGSSMFLLKIADGKVVKDYVYKTGSANGTNKVQVNSTIKVNTIVCTPMYTQHWVQQCYATDPEGANMVCGQWVLEGTDYWDDCHDDGSSSGPPLTGDPCHDYGYCGTPTPPANPPPPPPQPNDPCLIAAALKANSTLNTELTDLKSKLNLNYETGYMATTSGTPQYLTGAPNTLSLTTPQPGTIANNSLLYFIHSHYAASGSLPIFSNGDVETFASYLFLGKAANVNTFTFSITTSQGTTYSLALNNQTNFNSFYNTYISDATGQNIFDHIFAGFVNSSNTAEQNESGFLKMMSTLNMGVSLIKQNANGTWSTKTWNSTTNQVTTIICAN